MQQRIYEEASDYKKQFMYLPLHVFNAATNIRALFSSKLKGDKKQLDLCVKSIHKQLGRKYDMWLPEMHALSFIDTNNTNADPIDDERVVKESKNSKKTVAATLAQAIPSKSKALETEKTPKETVDLQKSMVI